MDKIIEDQWTQALATLTGSVSPDRNYKASKGVLDKLALATSMLMTAIDPEIPPDKPAKVKGNISLLIRKGLAGWAGASLLDAFHRDAMENVVPLLQDMELQYQEYISAGTPYSGSAEWVIPAFYNIVHMVHARFTKSRMLAYIFDERLRPAADRDPPLDISSLKVTSRFLTDFSAELAIRLPPSFDEVAYLYFETVFRQYEEVHGDMAPGHIADMAGHYTRQGRDPQTEITGQHLGKKRRRVMQDGRFAMDLFVDDKDDELVEQIFHGGTGTADVEALEKEDHMQTYLDLCQRLEEIGFASHMTDVVTRMLYKRVESKILTSFKKRWSVATLESGKDWMSRVILPFLRLTLLPRKGREDPTGRKRYKMWASRLEFYFFKTFGDVRIKEFFDIIVECPDSKPAVLDLKTCIEWTGQRDQLQNAILAAMEKRLLHPGAETTDIIEFYICTIKYLRILDPSGVMLDRAARAINQYLRTRDDTMRAIVSCIVDDSSDLLTNSTEGIQSNVEADDEGSDDDTWVPEPVNAGPDLSSARRRMADIISVLANIYDTNDRFIEEFQTILADRLLHATDFKIDREIRQLELLKLRFGETDLQHCEVMLADIAESKRVNANIQTLLPDMTVSATIASRYYWPEIESESLELPDPFKRLLESYKATFQTTKPAQKLELFISMGLVDLELELEDRTLQFQVEPVYASIIYLFEEQDSWTLSALSAKLQVTEDILEQRVQFWIREGVLKESDRLQYHLIENASSL